MKRYNKCEIDELANILDNDGVISVPTDTVYGICGKANSKAVYEKIMRIKNRPKTKFLPVMCADELQIKDIAILNENALKLIHTFMPGPITLILNKKQSANIENGDSKIAIRMATSKELEQLIKKIKTPIFMTSANISGKPVCETLDEIEKFCPDLDGMLEGNVSFGKESTIVDCTLDKVKIQRIGVITENQIINVISK